MNTLKTIKIGIKSLQTIILIVLTIISSCKEDNHANIYLNASEMSFNETLSSISKEGNDYYIGTENGIIYKYNSLSNKIDTLYTSYERIYIVKRDSDFYWVGSRNHGLHRCHIKKSEKEGSSSIDSLAEVKEAGDFTFLIPSTKTGTDYSCYDILIKDSTIFTTTSNGLYYASYISSSKDLKELYIQPKNIYSNKIEPKVTASFLEVFSKDGSSQIFCSSQMGLLKINPLTKKVDIIDPSVTSSIVIKDSTIFTFSFEGEQGKLTARDLSGKELKGHTFKLPSSAKYYYNYGDISYFISNSGIQAINDDNLWKDDAKKYVKTIFTHKPIRTECHNIIAIDDVNNQSLLIANNVLTKIAYHQDIFNQTGKVSAISDDGDEIYYMLEDKHLYVQHNSSKSEKMEANQIYDLPDKLSADFMTVTNGILYFNDGHLLYKVKLKESYLLNSLFTSEELIDSLKTDITAINSKDGNLYIGVRDSLLCLTHGEDSIKTINGAWETPYITIFHKEKDKICFATLNDGAYYGKDTDLYLIPKSNSFKFIRDIDIDENDSIYLLTNHNLFKTKGDGNISLCLENFKATSPINRVFATEGDLFGIGDRGIYDLKKSKSYLQDIQFIPKSCLMHNGKLYAGSTNGVFVFDTKRGLSEKPQSIIFNPNTDLLSKRAIMILFIIIIAAIGLWIWYLRKKHQRKLNKLKEEKEKESNIRKEKEKELSNKEKEQKRIIIGKDKKNAIDKFSSLEKLLNNKGVNILGEYSTQTTNNEKNVQTTINIEEEINKKSVYSYSFKEKFDIWFEKEKNSFNKKITEIKNLEASDYKEFNKELDKKVSDMENECNEFLNICLKAQKEKLEKSENKSFLHNTVHSLEQKNRNMEMKITQIINNYYYLLHEEYLQLICFIEEIKEEEGKDDNNKDENNKDENNKDENNNDSYDKIVEALKEKLKKLFKDQKANIKTHIEKTRDECAKKTESNDRKDCSEQRKYGKTCQHNQECKRNTCKIQEDIFNKLEKEANSLIEKIEKQEENNASDLFCFIKRIILVCGRLNMLTQFILICNKIAYIESLNAIDLKNKKENNCDEINIDINMYKFFEPVEKYNVDRWIFEIISSKNSLGKIIIKKSITNPNTITNPYKLLAITMARGKHVTVAYINNYIYFRSNNNNSINSMVSRDMKFVKTLKDVKYEIDNYAKTEDGKTSVATIYLSQIDINSFK